MTDKTLERAVIRALHLDSLVNAGGVTVTARDGEVTLSGRVDTSAQRLATRYAAERVPGVKFVADALEVCAYDPPRQSGDPLAAAVVNALKWDLAVPSDRVRAKCENGWVTLTGEVERPYESSSAEADVRKIRGVVGVTNEIKVGAR